MTRMIGATLLLVTLTTGCMSPSRRLAVAGNARATVVQTWCFEKTHFALRSALYRECLEQLDDVDANGRAEVLYNMGDKLEEAGTWQEQFHRAGAIRDSTATAHLESQGNVFGLAGESLKARIGALAGPPETPAPAPPPAAPVAPAAMLEPLVPLAQAMRPERTRPLRLTGEQAAEIRRYEARHRLVALAN